MPPETTLEAPQTAERPPSPALADFDSTFADLDTPQSTPNETISKPTTDVPETTRNVPAKDPATGKFTKQEAEAVPKDGTKDDQGNNKPPVAETEKVQVGVRSDPKPTLGEYEPPRVARPNELRGWAQKMGSRAEKAEQQLVQLNRQIQELRSQPQQNTDVQATVAELAATKKRLEEYESELKVTRYERSGEYKDKYEKPYQNAVRNAYNEVGELLVSVPNPADPDNPTERQATAQDFDEVYSLPLGPATKLAKQKFGDAASIVIQHVKAIKDARRSAVTAVEEHKGQAQAFEQQQTAQAKMMEEGRSRMFNEALGAISQKYPTLFDQRDGDTAWNEALTKGRSMADLAYGDRSQLTPQQNVILDAQIFARVSAFPALKQHADKLETKLAAIEKELGEIRGSAPGKTAPGAAKPEKSADLSMEAAFDRDVPA